MPQNLVKVIVGMNQIYQVIVGFFKPHKEKRNTDFDWQSFRAEAAKDILCAMINHFGTSQLDVNESVIWADILIEKLKEKEEK